ncbi:dehydratase [Francisella halioticida]|uniref:Hydroxymyristoyl-ACP dehydratase n=1 Tax=Francisella halioticida TaxID=549298 RepID=A0ABN5B443_9GAMM|nr:hydroxymyristoyl-ACP dehydratase [Francisella halioticida]ASG68890.1 hydroxymyristoyl-ACP dehydratase [Francisella halioticida]BCD91879.1 dehydratase [Francisella halioticida]
MIKNYFEIKNIKIDNDHSAVISSYVSKECDFFRGHFDNYPILPGIAQLELIINLANHVFKLDRFSVSEIPQTKFKMAILPDSQITIKLINNNNCISFEILLNNEQASLGKINYG